MGLPHKPLKFWLLQAEREQRASLDREKRLKAKQKVKDRVRIKKERLAAEKEAREKAQSQALAESDRKHKGQDEPDRCCAALQLLFRQCIGILCASQVSNFHHILAVPESIEIQRQVYQGHRAHALAESLKWHCHDGRPQGKPHLTCSCAKASRKLTA